MADVLQAVNDFLIARGVVRDPRTPGDEPPLWVEVDVPAPGEGPSRSAVEVGPTLVVGAQLATAIPTGPFASNRRKPCVEFILRGLDVAEIQTTHKAIRDAFLHGAGAGDAGHLAYEMAGLFVLECVELRELQPLERTPQGSTFTCEFLFETYA